MTRASSAACVVATRNYLASARALCDSWLEHHPTSTATVVLVDGDPAAVGWRPEGVDLVSPTDLGIEPDELLRMAGIYGPGELAMALKPWALRHLLGRADVAVYFDGDIEVLAPVDDVVERALDGVVLTPHTLGPLPDDGRLPGAPTILTSGTYNAGFLAVSANDGGFLDWWGGVLARHCVHDLDRGLHGDQRWLDLVPSWFPHVIERDPTCNVAYWNMHERPLDWSDGRLLTGGRPVRFVHFSGLVPGRPWTLSQYAGADPRTSLATDAPVARASRRWVRRLDTAGRAADAAHPYRYATTAGGLPLDTRARRVYRQALLDHEAGTGPEPPGPFADDGGAAFEAWLLDPGPDEPLGRYVRRMWDESPPMQGRYPDVDGRDRAEWLRWVGVHGRLGADVPDAIHARLDLDPDPDLDLAVDHDREDQPVTDRPDPLAPPPADSDPTAGPDPVGVPLPGAEAAAALLDRSPTTDADPPTGAAGRRLQETFDRLSAARDERTVELGRHLLDAVGELQRHVAVVDARLAHALAVDLVHHDVRLAILEEAAVGAQKTSEDVAAVAEGRAAGLAGRLDALADQIAGALEQDVVTANIVADTERRLLDELRARRDRPDDGAAPA